MPCPTFRHEQAFPSWLLSPQEEFQIERPFDRIQSIGSDLAEAEKAVEGNGLGHGWGGIQTQTVISDFTGFVDRRNSQRLPDPEPAKRGANIEPFQLTDPVVQRPKSHAASFF